MWGNIQSRLARNNPPRVQITYDVELGGAQVKKELPVVIGIIADCTGLWNESGITEYVNRKFIFIDKDNFNEVLTKSNARSEVVFNMNGGNISYVLQFSNIEDFNPLKIAEQIPELKKLIEIINKLNDIKTRVCNNQKYFDKALLLIKDKTIIITDLIKDMNFKSEEQSNYTIALFENLKTIINESTNFDNPIKLISEAVNEREIILFKCLNDILHNKDLKKLESTWRGIHYLISNLEFSTGIKVRLLNATFNEVNNDLSKAIEFDQSFLFKKLYEEEYGTYGGNPYTVLICDYYIDKNNTDFMFLFKLSEVSASAHIPTILGINPGLLDLDSFEDLIKPRDVAAIFESPEYIKWKGFRAIEDSRYFALILPRFMIRAPYGPKSTIIEGLEKFEEEINCHEDYLWSNSVYAYAQRIGDAYAKYGWFAAIVGAENGGVVSGLPAYVYKTPEGDMLIKCPTETAVTDRRERELTRAGFISLCYCKNTDYSVFFSTQSANKPPLYNTQSANANAEISARFHYILNMSRFAHYIKCILRDKIGSFFSKESAQRFLNIWIGDYVLRSDDAADEYKALYPLRDAAVNVVEDPVHPGSFKAIIYLRPHFQLEEITVSLRLVARIPN